MARQQILRAFRFTLAPTRAQEIELRRYAGAARWAFNHALAAKMAAHELWRGQVATLVEAGVAEDVARKKVKLQIPQQFTLEAVWRATRGDSRSGQDGTCPWWHEVHSHCCTSAFRDADTAWKNWLDSLKRRRAGRRVGHPRFKRRGRSTESFRIRHDVKRPGIRLVSHRRLRIPRMGEIRLHDSGKRLARLIARGDAVVQSVTVSRGGHRWYASVLCKVMMKVPERPTRRQAAAGVVGLDLGVTHLVALSQPADLGSGPVQLVDNPRYLSAVTRRLRRAQQVLARKQNGSVRRDKAKQRISRLHGQMAVRRAGFLHTVTKRLATGFHTVAVEDLNVIGMTRSVRGTREVPGRNVRQKAGLNRSILDASPAEIRRQLAYKTSWYGSNLAVVDRWFPSSKTCSACGEQNPRLTLADRVFTCSCGLVLNRDVNAARNIAAHAVPVPAHVAGAVASDAVETINARGVLVSPSVSRDGRRGAAKREDAALVSSGATPAEQSAGVPP